MPYFGLRSYTDGCPTCAETSRGRNRGYMERYCPGCQRVFTSGRNKCHVCDLTTLRTGATKTAGKSRDCPDCGGTGQLHYQGQIGSEATPAEFLEALWACTGEWVRVLKPSGSMFINLGDKYAGAGRGNNTGERLTNPLATRMARYETLNRRQHVGTDLVPAKSLMGLPWRYAIGALDRFADVGQPWQRAQLIERLLWELADGEITPDDVRRQVAEFDAGPHVERSGLILRAEIIWAKPNGLPESVTDRVRRAHEQVFHFTKRPRYYAAVDEIREPQTGTTRPQNRSDEQKWLPTKLTRGSRSDGASLNPLGKLPGSVWTIPSAPLQVPARLGIDHFACVDAETEILTEHGWLRHDQLIPGHMVAGYDLDTSTARWTECTAVNRYDYDSDLIAVESRDLSMRLTPNHRTIVQRMTTRANRRSPVNVVRADGLDARHFIPRSAAWERYGDSYTSERIAAVMGWVAAEGWYEPNRVRLSQSLDANPAAVADINRLIPDASRTERKRTYRGQPYTEVTWTLGPMGTLIRREMPDKLLPKWLILASEPERRGCLNAFIDGDGHRRPDGRIAIFQKHRHNLDVLQAIAVTLGYKTTLREAGGRFVLYLTEGSRSITLRGTAGVGSKVRREHYRGTVWCPTTGTGTFIARRNGSVFVTGNSFPPALVRPLVLGWSPPGICTACGEGRRPTVAKGLQIRQRHLTDRQDGNGDNRWGTSWRALGGATEATITGYVCACTTAPPGHLCSECVLGCNCPDDCTEPCSADCACPDLAPQPPPTRPAVVLDPFAGTGTVPLVATVHGRTGIGIDLSHDYTRLARWRVNDPGERARALDVPKPPPVPDGQGELFEGLF